MTNKERNRLSDAHWEAVWARLEKEGRVNVPPPPPIPYCGSSCTAIDSYVKNPGATRSVQVVLQAALGSGGGE